VLLTEQAVDGAQPTVPKQHFLSQVVQRRWQQAVPGQGQVLRLYDLETGVEDYGTTKELGMVVDFVQVDSKTTEALWGKVETDFNGAVDQVVAGKVPTPKQVETLTACVALHYIRNPQVVKPHHDAFAAAAAAAARPLIESGLA
jgi:hypothetical protein